MDLSVEQSALLLDEYQEKDTATRRKSPESKWRITSIFLFAYGLLMTGIAVYLHSRTSYSHIPYSVAESVLDIHNREAHLNGKSIFSSNPSLEMHTAWRDLLSPSYIYATEEEVRLSGSDPRKILKLENGNYLAVLGAYHHLHCMRWLYFLAHEEVYWSNMTTAQRNSRRGHGKHCVQTLVDYLMCKPDIALYPVALVPEAENVLQLQSGAEWQCVNWDSLHSWALGRNMGYEPQLFAPASILEDLRMSPLE